MFWADKFANEIITSNNYKPYWVDDMKTPSGKIHVGSLRGVVIHDLLYKALIDKAQKTVFSYCINDMDPMDGFPTYLDREKFYKYMGCPLFKIPSPEIGSESFSKYYAEDFIKVFNHIGCFPKIIWTSKLYGEGKFDELIRIFLDNTEKIRNILKRQSPGFKDKDYYPYQPICPKCGKISTTKINKWDGEFVHFECKKDAVVYTQGCGYKGKITPVNLNGKLPWKIEWPAHWQILGITIEWAGKDHMTKGGSYEVASAICTEILHNPAPHAVLYEHLLIGGRKMSSSKGFGASAVEMDQLLPPEILRFFLARTDFRKTIDFNPSGNTIPDLFDEYDSFAKSYYKEKQSDFARIWELSQVKPIHKTRSFLPRFRDVANYMQIPKVNIYDKFSEIKRSKLTKEEIEILDERIKYAGIWLKNYAPEDVVYEVSKELPKETQNLLSEQKQYLISLIALINSKKWQPEELQQAMYELAKKMKINISKAFQSVYLVLTGKTHGPKAAWFILEQDKNKLIKRFKEASK